MRKRFRFIPILIIGLLPSSKFKIVLLKCFGFEISFKSVIQSNILWNIQNLRIESGAKIRFGNIFKGVSVVMGKNSIIGSFNWVTCAPGLSYLSDFSGALSVGIESAINSRNYLDCTGGIKFGNFSDLAGVRSTLITHQINTARAEQSCQSIEVGDFCLISSNCKFVPGVEIGDKSLVAMGSVLPKKIYPKYSKIAGVPGRVIGQTQGLFFSRSSGPIA